MEESLIKTGEAGEQSPATQFHAPNIHTGQYLSERIDLAINRWIDVVGLEVPKTPNELIPDRHETVSEFAAKIMSFRERALRMKHTGAVTFQGNDNLTWSMEIPFFLDRFMSFGFGEEWKQDPEIWSLFKKKFKMGLLNPSPKNESR